MKFDFLINAEDRSIELEEAYKKCCKAEMLIQNSLYKDCISLYYQAFMIVVKYIYKAEELDEPIMQHIQYTQRLTNADYVHKDSPFAYWLDNKFVLALCHDIRRQRNNLVFLNDEENWQLDIDAFTDQMEMVLRFVINKMNAIHQDYGRVHATKKDQAENEDRIHIEEERSFQLPKPHAGISIKHL